MTGTPKPRRRAVAYIRMSTGLQQYSPDNQMAVIERYAAEHDMEIVATLRAPLCRAKYAALRARGHGHARALRSIGDRLIAVACAMLTSQTEFDPDRSTNSGAA